MAAVQDAKEYRESRPSEHSAGGRRHSRRGSGAVLVGCPACVGVGPGDGAASVEATPPTQELGCHPDVCVRFGALRPNTHSAAEVVRVVRDSLLPVSPHVGGTRGRTKAVVINELRSCIGLPSLPPALPRFACPFLDMSDMADNRAPAAARATTRPRLLRAPSGPELVPFDAQVRKVTDEAR